MIPSMIPSMILFFVLQNGLFLEYPSSWNQGWWQNRVSFIANKDDPHDRYSERVDIYHYPNDDNYMSGNMMVKSSSLCLEVINEINYLASNIKNLDLISVNNTNFSNFSDGE
jgi:hypothetical protein